MGLCKTKIWRKSKIVLYRCRQFHCIHKKDGIYKDIAEDVETRFDTSNYELDRPLTKREKQKSSWINERLIRWKNHGKICWIKSKNV